MLDRTNLSQILGVFSRRDHSSDEIATPLTEEFKNRMMRPLWNIYDQELWENVHIKLEYLLGHSVPFGTYMEEGVPEHLLAQTVILNYMGHCDDATFFDLVELMFQSESSWNHGDLSSRLIEHINIAFELDDLPYFLTGFVYREIKSTEVDEITGVVRSYAHQVVDAYPRIIWRENEVIHQTAIEPTLTILKNPSFSFANKEFLDALKDYREGDYGDCVVKCGSSFESVMKIICEERGWPSQKDAGKLLDTVLSKTDLPKFLKQPLIQTATIRNELGSAHGAGDRPRVVSKRLAQYTINSTASAVLLLVEEANS